MAESSSPPLGGKALFSLGAVAVAVALLAWGAYELVSDPLEGSFAVAHGDANPTWSPDGTRIAFDRDVEGEANQIYVVDADGGNIAKVTTDNLHNAHPSWSPDGRRIAYSQGGEAADLAVVDVDRGTVATLDTASLFAYAPAWSPDGREIAFANSGIYVVAAAGGPPRRLTRDGSSPAWSPDGTMIAYATSAAGIHVVGRDRSGKRRISASGFDPSWAPDGKRLVVAHAEGFGGGLQVIDLRGNVVVTLVPEAIATSPAWSPDGRRIAFTGEGGRLHVVGADGGDLRRITG